MKKLIFAIILFFIPFVVKGETRSKDIFLSNIKIDEFEISPVYNKYQNNYTIITTNYKSELKIYVDKENDLDKLSIVGNDNLEYGENKIQIVVYNEDYTKENIYNFYITFERTEEDLNVFQNLNQKQEERNLGITEVSMIVFGCYVIVITAFKYLFFK